MNLYRLHLFLMFFGSWVAAGEVSSHFRSGASEAQESPVAARAWAQPLRRLLKAMRKWCSSHPPEVKLDNRKESKKEQKKRSEPMRKPFQTEDSQAQVIQNNLFPNILPVFTKTANDKSFISTVRRYLNEAFDNYQYYRGVFVKNQLIVCLWDYFLKKFWAWVDSAPDS